MAARATESEVQRQIKHMMAFIEQEASEKVEEIDAKAEEEFNIEKGRLVQQQRVKIMDYYDKKEKQVNLQKKIQSSNLMNQSRLRVLKMREDHVRMVLEDTRKRLGEVTRKPEQYQKVLQSLIVQGLFQMLEPVAIVRCRQADAKLVQAAIPEALEVYRNSTHKDCSIKIDTENPLPADICGGVELVAQKGRIKVANTLEARLEMISQQMVPHIRQALFGRNLNRKFAD